MKEIKAIIRTDVLEKVLRALRAMKNLPGCTVSHVHGYHKSVGTSLDSEPENEEMTKLELVIKDTDVKRVIDEIAANARTGGPGDGKIFVLDCAEIVSIRTGQRGDAAV
ncbi:MAG: P-II family nitrogen regulator [Elusimicrobiota bacterium]|nr:MAG: P-II family nitrogen regulator [Elusimicrobiota bacterium]